MRVFALSDLHLSFFRDKPMDIFGDHWRDHPRRIAEAWRERVQPEDLVLLGGDLSWAMKLDEMAEEWEYLSALPGRKVLIRGNHDYWWSSDAKVRKALPEGFVILNGHAAEVSPGLGIAGTRLWNRDSAEGATPEDAKIYRRELGRLERALQELDSLEVIHRVVMVHYPPTEVDDPSPAEELLQKYRVQRVIYGHLHSAEEHAIAVDGKVRGIEYHLTAADFLGFAPKLIFEDAN